MTDHDIQRGKFEAVTKALDEDLSYAQFRKSMFEAYGVEKQIPQGIDITDIDEASRREREKELDFAQRCLEGRGPNITEVFRKTGDLREVLLIELCTHPDPPRFPKKPWLMGDWQFLAERIVDVILRSEMFPESDSAIARHRSAQVVRVWPTVRGSWRDVGEKVLSKGNLVEVNLDLDDMGHNLDDVGQRTIKVRSNQDRWSDMSYNWIVLPTGPGVLTDSDGIPAHLWTGFREDDGT